MELAWLVTGVLLGVSLCGIGLYVSRIKRITKCEIACGELIKKVRD